jgi:hypothetical protein
MELKDRIIKNLEWSNKRLKLIGKGLDEEQMEIIEFSLLHDLLQFSLNSVGSSSEKRKELIEAYKECFELFIPSEKWDEATLFLSTYNCGLAKDMAKTNFRK